MRATEEKEPGREVRWVYLEPCPIPSFSGETPAGLRGQQPAGEEGLLPPTESQGLRAGWGQHPSSQSLAVWAWGKLFCLSVSCALEWVGWCPVGWLWWD